MPSVETKPNKDASSFRLDLPLQSLLTQPGSRTVVPPAIKPDPLPDPVFPQYPLLGERLGSADAPSQAPLQNRARYSCVAWLGRAVAEVAEVVPAALLLHSQPHPGVLLQRFRQALNRFQGTTNFD